MNSGGFSTALGSVAEEIYATTGWSAVGFARPDEAGRVRLEIRNRVAVSSYVQAFRARR